MTSEKIGHGRYHEINGSVEPRNHELAVYIYLRKLILTIGRLYKPNTLFMAKRIIDLLLTDVKFHANHLRPASTLEKAAKQRTPEGMPYGRLTGTAPAPSIPSGYQMLITLPADLQAQVDSGEVEVKWWMPKIGLPTSLDKSVAEKLEQIDRKHTNMAIHRSSTWKSE